MSSGIPHGTILAPILFSLIAIYRWVSYNQLQAYGDDAVVYATGKTFDSAVERLHSGFEKVSAYLDESTQILKLESHWVEM